VFYRLKYAPPVGVENPGHLVPGQPFRPLGHEPR
jgi:hypothetical protein